MSIVLPALRGRHRAHRALQAAVLLVLLLRGLLSGVVMFDAQTPSGGFGLVLCSGAGALFPPSAFAPTGAADAAAERGGMSGMSGMSGMADMPGMSRLAQPPVATSDTRSRHQDAAAAPMSMADHGSSATMTGTDSGVCAFSAALCLAIVVLATLGVWRLPAPRRQRLRTLTVRPAARQPAYRFARSRAPPFSIVPA